MSDIEALAKRCEHEHPSMLFSDLDWRIHRAFGRSAWSYFCRRSDYTTDLTAAASLLPPGTEWDMTCLYGVARVSAPLNHSNFGPCHGSHEGGFIPMAICAAALRMLDAEIWAEA